MFGGNVLRNGREKFTLLLSDAEYDGFLPLPHPFLFLATSSLSFQSVVFRFRVRLGRDCVNCGLQRNTNPGQYWPVLCEQKLISYLGLTLTRVYELSMWQFTSWS